MNRFFATWLVLRFWSSPHHKMEVLTGWSDVRAERNVLKILDPGFPFEDPVEEPPPRPVQPVPTDVPVPEPRDVPAPEPHDVPAPDPGKVPPTTEPPQRPEEPKPRPVP